MHELQSSLRQTLQLLSDQHVDALRPLTRSSSFEIRSAVATIRRILPQIDEPQIGESQIDEPQIDESDRQRSDSRQPSAQTNQDPSGSDGHRREPRQESVDEAFSDRVREAIEAGMGAREFNVEMLAKELGMDRSHLYRRVRLISGQSPSKLIREQRLARAARLLRGQSGTVSEIAYRVGFKSLAHFSSAFRKRYRMPPSHYGKQRTAAPASLPGPEPNSAPKRMPVR